MFGLEKTVAFEMKMAGCKQVKCYNGRVIGQGGFEELARVNIISRTAERVRVLLGEFEATTFEQLFDGVYQLPFGDWIDVKEAFPVKGFCIDSKLMSVPDCQAIIKKAVVKCLQKRYRVDWFEECRGKVQISFGIRNNMVSISLDSTGVSLHKRGYRKESGGAPIKETLAAGIVDLARIREGDLVFDPCCGSGTLLIEAAMKALHIAPGLNRNFACEQWAVMPEGVFDAQRQKAQEEVIKDGYFEGVGRDIDPEVLKLARHNAKLAGVDRYIQFARGDVNQCEWSGEGGTLLCNPPYGERMLGQVSCRKIYHSLGNIYKNNQLHCYIITSDLEFEKAFGKQAVRRRKLYNGELVCQVYIFF